MSKVSQSIKRAMDFLLAGIGLLVLSPVIAIISVAIWMTMGRPIFFRQRRPGYLGRPFTVIKFRTMTVGDTAATEFSDTARLTRLGKTLRQFSLDEFPQLWNVVRGDMSLVGPRPLLMEYLERYTPTQATRHNVMPGITGWAQVHGRQHIPFSQRLQLDVWYVEHASLGLDLKILLLTVKKIVSGAGVDSGQDVRDVDDLGLHPASRKSEKSE